MTHEPLPHNTERKAYAPAAAPLTGEYQWPAVPRLEALIERRAGGLA
jgi:hypothetical protein